MNSWRLTSELDALVIIGKNRVYLSASEKKSYLNSVISEINDEYAQIHLFENNFKVKLDGTSVYISSPGLPPEIEWYKAENFYQDKLEDLIKYHKIDHGNFQEDLQFEVIFNDEIPGKFGITSTECLDYPNYLEEMTRRFNCEMCKKTKSWIPGHRYDTPEKSVYYLFPIKSHINDPDNSEYIDEGPEVYVCTEKTPSGKTISEVLKNISFNDIKIYRKKLSYVDSGEYLMNDFTNYQDYLEDLINNSINTENIKNFLDIFSIGKNKISDLSRIRVENKIRDILLDDVIIKNWNINKFRKDQYIGDDSKEKNPENLKKLFLASYINDKNFSRVLYYETLLEKLGINLEELIKDSLSAWGSLSLKTDFNDYIKYLEYFKLRDKGLLSNQRVTTAKYTTETNSTLESILGAGELTNTIIELLKYSRGNYGFGVTEYHIVNVGTKSKPQKYITAKVTIDDIIKYKKGISEIPENLKNDILRNSFVSVTVIFDELGKIE